MKTYVRALFIALLLGTPLKAQLARAPMTDDLPRASTCTYLECALGITPAWNGLDVTDGGTGRRVATLGFFWPRRVDATFAGSDSALSYATRAFRVRRTAAVFTDAGLLLLGYAAVRQVNGGLHGTDRVVGALGAGAFAIGVPLQFSADGLLSHAVWWHNSRF